MKNWHSPEKLHINYLMRKTIRKTNGDGLSEKGWFAVATLK
jgi:hypothetical protein